MKAILKYGQFTHMVELPEVRPVVYIPKPADAPTAVAIPEGEAPNLYETSKLTFVYKKQLYGDIHIYEFEREE